MSSVGFHGNGVARHWAIGRSASSLRTRAPRPSQRRLPRMLEGVRPRAPAIDITETLSSAVASGAIARRGRFAIALSGGNTPKPVYQRLAAAMSIDWTRVHVFFGDERCVPPDDSRSNYHMARTSLIDHVAIPAENVHRMRGEDAPDTAADGSVTATVARHGLPGKMVDDDLVCPPPVSTCDHPARRLALCAFHSQLARRRGSAR